MKLVGISLSCLLVLFANNSSADPSIPWSPYKTVECTWKLPSTGTYIVYQGFEPTKVQDITPLEEEVILESTETSVKFEVDTRAGNCFWIVVVKTTANSRVSKRICIPYSPKLNVRAINGIPVPESHE